MISRITLFAPLLALSFAVGCPTDDADTDTDTAGTAVGTTAATAEPTTGGAADVTCADYCTAITANCTGATAQYGSMEACMGSCTAFDVGTAADTAGNTLGCRLYHAGAAKADPATHCVHAGPGGAGVCGADCDGFCAIAADACAGTFADDAACQTACKAYDATESYDASDVAGDTLACRLYHLTVATTDAATHCPHILPDSAPCAAAP